MSHINEALKKAQKERDARHLKYQGLFAARGKKRRAVSGKGFWLTLACLVLIVIVFRYSPWTGDTATQTTTESENKDRNPARVPVTREIAGAEGKVSKRASTPVRQASRRPEEKAERRASRPVRQASTGSEGQVRRPAPGPVTPASAGSESKIKTPAPGDAAQRSAGSEDKTEKPVAMEGPTELEKARQTYDRAKDFHRRGRLDLARRLYQETLKSDPGYVDALNNLGVIFIREGNYPAAQRHFEKAMRLEPANAEPFYNLACLHAIKGEVKEGLALLQRAVSIDVAARDWARQDSDLENLRGTPEFEALVGK